MTQKQTKKKNKRGRPRSEFTPAVLREMELYEGSASSTDIQRYLGVSSTVFYKWRKEHPDFDEAVMRAKDRIDDQVENRLLKRALGYDYVETRNRTEEGGKEGGVKVVEETANKHVVPDVGAAMNWLKNRRPDKWREQSHVNITGSFAEEVERRIREREKAAENDA